MCIRNVTNIYTHNFSVGGNPVLDISQEELDEEANNIMAQGDPVAAFLASDEFQSVDPDTEEVCVYI